MRLVPTVATECGTGRQRTTWIPADVAQAIEADERDRDESALMGRLSRRQSASVDRLRRFGLSSSDIDRAVRSLRAQQATLAAALRSAKPVRRSEASRARRAQPARRRGSRRTSRSSSRDPADPDPDPASRWLMRRRTA